MSTRTSTRSPFEGIELPHLPEEFEDVEFSEQALRKAFGPLAKVVQEAYIDFSESGTLTGPLSAYGEQALFTFMLRRLKVAIRTSTWDSDCGRVSFSGTDYFTLDRPAALTQVRAKIEELRRRFDWLSRTHQPDRSQINSRSAVDPP
jgi:hypothetical protein